MGKISYIEKEAGVRDRVIITPETEEEKRLFQKIGGLSWWDKLEDGSIEFLVLR